MQFFLGLRRYSCVLYALTPTMKLGSMISFPREVAVGSPSLYEFSVAVGEDEEVRDSPLFEINSDKKAQPVRPGREIHNNRIISPGEILPAVLIFLIVFHRNSLFRTPRPNTTDGSSHFHDVLAKTQNIRSWLFRAL